jgi:glycerol-3-phosphate dehydrogenase
MTNIISPKPDNLVNILILGTGTYAQTRAAALIDPWLRRGNPPFTYRITFWNYRPGGRVEKLKDLIGGKSTFQDYQNAGDTDIVYDFGKPGIRENIRVLAPEKEEYPQSSLEEACKEPYWKPHITYFATTSDGLSPTAANLSNHINEGTITVIGTKGVEYRDMPDVAEIWMPYQTAKRELHGVPRFIESGFNLWTRILRGEWQSSVIATGMKKRHGIGKSVEELKRYLKHVLSTPNWSIDDSPYLNTIQLAMIAKPIIAMSSGGIAGHSDEKFGNRYDNPSFRGNMINSYMNNLLPMIYALGGNTWAWLSEPPTRVDTMETANSPESGNYKAGKLIVEKKVKTEGTTIEEKLNSLTEAIKREIKRKVEGPGQLVIARKIAELNPQTDPSGLVQKTFDIFFNGADVGEMITAFLQQDGISYRRKPRMAYGIMILGVRRDTKSHFGLSYEKEARPIRINKKTGEINFK